MCRPRGLAAPQRASSELDLKAETVEALAVGKLAHTSTVTEWAAARTARGPISFAGLGAAGIQVAGGAWHREVTSLGTGQAAVLGL